MFHRNAKQRDVARGSHFAIAQNEPLRSDLAKALLACVLVIEMLLTRARRQLLREISMREISIA